MRIVNIYKSEPTAAPADPVVASRERLGALRHVCDTTIKDLHIAGEFTLAAYHKLHEEAVAAYSKMHDEVMADLHKLKSVTGAHHTLHDGLYDQYLKGFFHAIEILENAPSPNEGEIKLLRDELYKLSNEANPTN